MLRSARCLTPRASRIGLGLHRARPPQRGRGDGRQSAQRDRCQDRRGKGGIRRRAAAARSGDRASAGGRGSRLRPDQMVRCASSRSAEQLERRPLRATPGVLARDPRAAPAPACLCFDQPDRRPDRLVRRGAILALQRCAGRPPRRRRDAPGSAPSCRSARWRRGRRVAGRSARARPRAAARHRDETSRAAVAAVRGRPGWPLPPCRRVEREAETMAPGDLDVRT